MISLPLIWNVFAFGLAKCRDTWRDRRILKTISLVTALNSCGSKHTATHWRKVRKDIRFNLTISAGKDVILKIKWLCSWKKNSKKGNVCKYIDVFTYMIWSWRKRNIAIFSQNIFLSFLSRLKSFFRVYFVKWWWKRYIYIYLYRAIFKNNVIIIILTQTIYAILMKYVLKECNKLLYSCHVFEKFLQYVFLARHAKSFASAKSRTIVSDEKCYHWVNEILS